MSHCHEDKCAYDSGMNLLWFKRDLRLRDHPALSLAAADKQPVLPIYILEPGLWAQPDMSGRHYAFLRECLADLDQQLRVLGQPLTLFFGDAVEVLKTLRAAYNFTHLYSHQETWNSWTYARDLRVADWCKAGGIVWHEPPQNGLIRRLKDRDAWLSNWYGHVNDQRAKPPARLVNLKTLPLRFRVDALPHAADLGLAPDPCPGRQKGGRAEAVQLLTSFLNLRGQTYTRSMSSPLTAYQACSRLSPHLAFGTLSVREAYQACEAAKHRGPTSAAWRSARRSFQSRLRWHCHFIQRLEDQPDMETHNLHRAYDGLRGYEASRLTAWQAGQTGYPLIDACMRALNHTGWLNFRMRSMLMSFAAYHLWLDWQAPARHLARQFTDYEPGIHYSQVQMQSGTSGINAIRVYSPTKQARDQDPEGEFIRTWVPELANMPQGLIHTPWKAPELAPAYPLPVVGKRRQGQRPWRPCLPSVGRISTARVPPKSSKNTAAAWDAKIQGEAQENQKLFPYRGICFNRRYGPPNPVKSR